MSKICENRYKMCRNTAGIKQEHAAETLNISLRTLSDYENGHAKVPDDIVAAMAEAYGAPILAWWHLKQTSVLGKYLPDIMMPTTNGDMAFQLVLADDDLSPAVTEVKRIMADGHVTAEETERFDAAIEVLRNVNAKLLSVIVYAQGSKKCA